MEYMNKAVLYARVSSDAQQKEGTIESQVVELKKQIAAAGHVLVKEYIDDGITGIVLDRPALEELRCGTSARPAGERPLPAQPQAACRPAVLLTLWRAPFLQHIEERSAAKETKTTYHK